MPNITNLETQRSAQNALELEAYFGIVGSSKPMKKVFKLPWPDRVPIMIDSMIGGFTLLSDFHLTRKRDVFYHQHRYAFIYSFASASSRERCSIRRH